LAGAGAPGASGKDVFEVFPVGLAPEDDDLPF
jgi:hypothetical protein